MDGVKFGADKRCSHQSKCHQLPSLIFFLFLLIIIFFRSLNLKLRPYLKNKKFNATHTLMTCQFHYLI